MPIKYSNVDRQFIKEIQQSNVIRKHFLFIIDIKIVCKWLKVDKGHIKRTLLRSYMDSIDYIILLPLRGKQKKGRGGHNNETI